MWSITFLLGSLISASHAVTVYTAGDSTVGFPGVLHPVVTEFVTRNRWLLVEEVSESVLHTALFANIRSKAPERTVHVAKND